MKEMILYTTIKGVPSYLKSKEEEQFPSFTDKIQHAVRFSDLNAAQLKAKRMGLEAGLKL